MVHKMRLCIEVLNVKTEIEEKYLLIKTDPNAPSIMCNAAVS